MPPADYEYGSWKVNNNWFTTSSNTWYTTITTNVTNISAVPLYVSGDYARYVDMRPTNRSRAARKGWVTRRKKQKDKAEIVARQLLLSLLDDEQKETFLSKQYIEIVSQKGNIYRLKWGRSWNVRKIENGKIVLSACCHPKANVPNSDTLIAQMLTLQTAEDEFLKKANIVHKDTSTDYYYNQFNEQMPLAA